MILQFARSLAVREQLAASQRRSPVTVPLSGPTPSPGQPACPVRPAPSAAHAPATCPRVIRPLSIRRDPSDGRRTVIAGRFADVCAALDRLTLELEPAA